MRVRRRLRGLVVGLEFATILAWAVATFALVIAVVPPEVRGVEGAAAGPATVLLVFVGLLATVLGGLTWGAGHALRAVGGRGRVPGGVSMLFVAFLVLLLSWPLTVLAPRLALPVVGALATFVLVLAVAMALVGGTWFVFDRVRA